jgi:GntR family transcriptional regulator of arabinose operon
MNFPYVLPDDIKAGMIAANCLIKAGHKNIGAIFKSDDIQGHRRYAGFVQALKAADLKTDNNSVIWYETENFDEMFSGKNSKSKDILRMASNCTGVICYNDQAAVRLKEFFSDNEIEIPDDISVVGFDDSEMAGMPGVKLTSIAHPRRILGEEAAKRLLLLIQGYKGDISLIMEPVLVERSSVNKLT